MAQRIEARVARSRGRRFRFSATRKPELGRVHATSRRSPSIGGADAPEGRGGGERRDPLEPFASTQSRLFHGPADRRASRPGRRNLRHTRGSNSGTATHAYHGRVAEGAGMDDPARPLWLPARMRNGSADPGRKSTHPARSPRSSARIQAFGAPGACFRTCRERRRPGSVESALSDAQSRPVRGRRGPDA